jgi:hypothetical protein
MLEEKELLAQEEKKQKENLPAMFTSISAATLPTDKIQKIQKNAKIMSKAH